MENVNYEENLSTQKTNSCCYTVWEPCITFRYSDTCTWKKLRNTNSKKLNDKIKWNKYITLTCEDIFIMYKQNNKCHAALSIKITQHVHSSK